jgi:hypothetical protein
MAKQFKYYLLANLLLVFFEGEFNVGVLPGGRLIDILSVAVLSELVVGVQAVFLNVIEGKKSPLAELVCIADVVSTIEVDEGVLLVVLVKDTLELVRNLLEVDHPLRLEELEALDSDLVWVQSLELFGDLHRFVDHGVVKLASYCYFGTHFNFNYKAAAVSNYSAS